MLSPDMIINVGYQSHVVALMIDHAEVTKHVCLFQFGAKKLELFNKIKFFFQSCLFTALDYIGF